ncbi:MAG TPA: hypothetical protein VGQ15_02130 [Gaiellaceae bacterium]|nr:hypothetical protein [Gaiellaceae bacterium]
MDGHMLVEVIFMLVILKIPVVYLCLVVWWAVRAEPRPPEPALSPARLPELQPCPWSRRGRARPRPSPCRGAGSRRPAPVLRAGVARR